MNESINGGTNELGNEIMNKGINAHTNEHLIDQGNYELLNF